MNAKDAIKKQFIINKDGHIFMVPEHANTVYDKNIRYLRTGVCIGKYKNSGQFIPHTAFALSLGQDDFKNCLDLSADDPEVIKYLKGETLILEGDKFINIKKGYLLICVDSYPLGFGYSDGKKIKNLYEKGWVYR